KTRNSPEHDVNCQSRVKIFTHSFLEQRRSRRKWMGNRGEQNVHEVFRGAREREGSTLNEELTARES
ncbi:hypothetical protein LEMLEM_LOCUS22914, partial [Lemmus lemmus]